MIDHVERLLEVQEEDTANLASIYIGIYAVKKKLNKSSSINPFEFCVWSITFLSFHFKMIGEGGIREGQKCIV